MAVKLMYITNNPIVAQIVERHSVDTVWVDLETIGKVDRQKGMNTVKSNHVIGDVTTIRNVISSSELLVRVNSIYYGSENEIKESISRGADAIMLPYFSTIEEVDKFMRYCDKADSCHSVKRVLLLETIGAEQNIEKILQNYAVDEVHIGINDLHIQYKLDFMFELLANGKVEEIIGKVSKYNVKVGFGGIAKLDEGLLPARHILAEHYRMGSSMAILSRSFCDSWISDDYEEIERSFKYGIGEIRDYETRLENETDEFFAKNQLVVKKEVSQIIDEIKRRRSGN